MNIPDTVVVGDVSITRVMEWSGPIFTGQQIVPESSRELWEQHRDVLVPDFWDPVTDAYRCHIQSWVVRSEGAVIVVDTGVGNDRDRPHRPPFEHLRTGYLDNLTRAGVAPEDVDVVVNTHLHDDHVGWNTRRVGDHFEPTFPNARYLMPRVDFDYFHPDNEHERPCPVDEFEQLDRTGWHMVFDDSVAPVQDAGLATLWRDGHRLDRHLTLEPAPGHTPGSSVLWVRSKNETAVFVGDLLHSPVQLFDPDLNSCFCEDPRGAATTRRRVLERADAEQALVIPAHLPGHSAATIRKADGGFRIRNWASW